MLVHPLRIVDPLIQISNFRSSSRVSDNQILTCGNVLVPNCWISNFNLWGQKLEVIWDLDRGANSGVKFFLNFSERNTKLIRCNFSGLFNGNFLV